MRKIAKLVATVFYTGYLPFAPGTFASILAAALYFVIKGHAAVYLTVTCVLLIAGFWASSVAEKEFPKKDPRQIVIDEFASMLLVYLFVPYSPKLFVAGFIIFRLLDIFKIPPLKTL